MATLRLYIVLHTAVCKQCAAVGVMPIVCVADLLYSSNVQQWVCCPLCVWLTGCTQTTYSRGCDAQRVCG